MRVLRLSASLCALFMLYQELASRLEQSLEFLWRRWSTRNPSNPTLAVHQMRVAHKAVVQIENCAEVVASTKVRVGRVMVLLWRLGLESSDDRSLHELHVPIFDDVECHNLHAAVLELLLEGVSPCRQHIKTKVLERREHKRRRFPVLGHELLHVRLRTDKRRDLQRWNDTSLVDRDQLGTSFEYLPIRVVQLLELGEHVGAILLLHLLLGFLNQDV